MDVLSSIKLINRFNVSTSKLMLMTFQVYLHTNYCPIFCCCYHHILVVVISGLRISYSSIFFWFQVHTSRLRDSGIQELINSISANSWINNFILSGNGWIFKDLIRQFSDIVIVCSNLGLGREYLDLVKTGQGPTEQY